ncbi:MAG: hypothetical protein M3N57_02640 [Actinomycetota bacterium]|nr:hypothetical protein [Actinomycetota bacterium]
MDVGARTAALAALDLGPDGEAYDLAVSTVQVATMADLATDLRRLVHAAPPGSLVGVASFATLGEVEPLAYYVGALTAVAADFAPPPLTPTAFQLADPTRLAHRLRQVGLTEVRVRTATRSVRFDSARHLLEAVTRTDPIGAQRLEALTDRQASDVEQVLDGMFRERSGGSRGAALRAVINVGRGRIARKTR